MIEIRRVRQEEKDLIKKIVEIHLSTFEGFFLTFMGRGFLTQMYRCYCLHEASVLYVAVSENEPIGFLAASSDMSGLYKFMIRKKLVPMAWYSLGAFFRRPTAFFRIIRAFLKPSESKRAEAYVELASIGVSPAAKKTGVGSALIRRLIADTDFAAYAYICLETDAENNEGANRFYRKNGFSLVREYETREGRKMNEYRVGGEGFTEHEEAALHTEHSETGQ